MLLEKHHMHEFDVANLYKRVFKTACAICSLIGVGRTASARAMSFSTAEWYAWAPAALSRSWAVSYTHLDVYKRQVPMSTGRWVE